MKLLAIGVMVAVLSGCSVGVNKLSAAVNAYCALPESARVVNRAAIDEAVQPHKIRITCNSASGH